MSQVFYIKPSNRDFPTAIKDGLFKALQLVQQKNISNIKFIVSHSSLVDSPPNFISLGIDLLFTGRGETLTKTLKKTRSFHITKFPTDAQTIGIDLVLANSNPTFSGADTVGLLVWADNDSFNKIESALFYNQIDLVAVVFNETDELNEMLSATKAINISTAPDPNIIPYQNNFSAAENAILERLKSINIGDGPTHTPTQQRIDSVVAELQQGNILISYKDFLGYLVNDVNYKLEDSVQLLNRRHRYFGR